MNNEFSFEITNESKNAINEILKQQGLRHFKLYTDFYGELDVINYEEYQKLEKEKNKEITRLNNIINELEKWLEDYIKLFNQPDMLEEQTLEDLKEVLDKLKELKEGKE